MGLYINRKKTITHIGRQKLKSQTQTHTTNLSTPSHTLSPSLTALSVMRPPSFSPLDDLRCDDETLECQPSGDRERETGGDGGRER